MKSISILILYTIFFISSYAQTPCPGNPSVEYAGKTYHTIQIGSQCWLKENLDVGKMIKGTKDQSNNNKIEKYCYNDDPVRCKEYGGLYQWAEAMQYSKIKGSQGICPSKWHIPTNDEFTILVKTVEEHGNRLKNRESIRITPFPEPGEDTGGNPSGFSAKMGGCRYYSGLFIDFVTNTFFWSSSEEDISFGRSSYESGWRADDIFLNSSSDYITQSYDIKASGFSVRCIKD